MFHLQPQYIPPAPVPAPQPAPVFDIPAVSIAYCTQVSGNILLDGKLIKFIEFAASASPIAELQRDQRLLLQRSIPPILS